MGTEWTDEDDDWSDAPTGIPAMPIARQTAAAAAPTTQGPVGRANGAPSAVAAPCAPIAAATPKLAQAPCSPVHAPHADKPQHFPAFVSRSALFRAGRVTGSVADAEPIEVKAQGCRIEFSGPRLNMRDKAVLEIAIQIAKEKNVDISQSFNISLRDFIVRLGESDFCSERLGSIWASLQRLAKARISFTANKGGSGVGSFIATAIKQAGKCHLRLNPDFTSAALLHDKQFRIRGERRNKLSSALAQWLHDFYSTHNVAKDVDLAYLRELCGFPGAAKNFPAKLREAMAELVAQAPGLVVSFSVTGDTRDSGAWTLSVARGPEMPEFEMPKIAAKTSSSMLKL